MTRSIVIVLGWVMVLTFTGLADTLTLKDGTVLEGTVLRQGKNYWIKTPDGQSRLIPEGQVLSHTRGSGASSDDAGGKTVTGSSNFNDTKRRADRVEVAQSAVAIWQEFIENNPNSPDLPAAQKELSRWREMAAGHAEKINGKWIWGEDRKQLLARVDKLIAEYQRDTAGSQTLQGIQKLEEAVKLYPNHFQANFELGFYYLVRGNNQSWDKAIAALERAHKLRPNSAATLSNLAIAYNFRQRYEQSVLTAYRAAMIEDSRPIVQNLVNAIAQAPPGMRQRNQKVLPIMEEATLLARKHGISNGMQPWTYVRPSPAEARREREQAEAAPGILGSGSGLIVSADGHILTNRHVVEGGNLLMVRFSDGLEKPATVVVIDKDQDIAIIKVAAPRPLPVVAFAPYDVPGVGADVTVLGFPLGDALGRSVKITRGVVTAIEPGQAECDIIVDAQVNPGNSGGPMVDRFGNLLALTAMKTGQSEIVSSYGLGISTGRIRTFLEKHKATLRFTVITASTEGLIPLSTEEIATKLTPATVCIYVIRE